MLIGIRCRKGRDYETNSGQRQPYSSFPGSTLGKIAVDDIGKLASQTVIFALRTKILINLHQTLNLLVTFQNSDQFLLISKNIMLHKAQHLVVAFSFPCQIQSVRGRLHLHRTGSPCINKAYRKQNIDCNLARPAGAY